MLSNFVTEGDKIELQAIERVINEKNGETQKVYFSCVHEIISDDTMEIIMPTEKTKLVLLSVDTEYDLLIYGKTGLYQCFARIIDRYKSNNMYILVVELTSNLRKYQRRDYYRFSCAMEMGTRLLEDDELQAVEQHGEIEFHPGLPLDSSVIVDISGGGIRFVSSQRYEPESYVFCSYSLLKTGERKRYEIVGKVLAVKAVEKRPETFEHRIKYHNLSMEAREEIIKYIFEEERKSRKKERLL